MLESSVTGKYTTLSFANDVPFITGDEIIYHTTGTAISGLESGRTYYVQLVGTSKNTIRLFNARSFINTTKYVEFAQYSTASTHSFTLKQHYQKFFPLRRHFLSSHYNQISNQEKVKKQKQDKLDL